MLDELRRLALFTSGVAELTRNRAEQLVKDMMAEGEVRRDQASSLVREVVERSNQNRRELLRFVRSEVQNQVAALGLANKRDLERLERRIARLEGAKTTALGKRTAKKTTTRKPASTAATSPRTPSGRSGTGTTRGAKTTATSPRTPAGRSNTKEAKQVAKTTATSSRTPDDRPAQRDEIP